MVLLWPSLRFHFLCLVPISICRPCGRVAWKPAVQSPNTVFSRFSFCEDKEIGRHFYCGATAEIDMSPSRSEGINMETRERPCRVLCSQQPCSPIHYGLRFSLLPSMKPVEGATRWFLGDPSKGEAADSILLPCSCTR